MEAGALTHGTAHQQAWIGMPGKSEGIAAMVVGDNVSLRLREGPNQGAKLVGVNDLTQLIELKKPLAASNT